MIDTTVAGEPDRPAPPTLVRERGWHRTPILAGTAGLALSLGTLVYLTDRVGGHALLIPPIAALAGHPLFGVLAPWLPSFVHPFAFSLLTEAVLAPRPTWRYAACLFWGLVNIAFEVGQHPQLGTRLAEFLQAHVGHGPAANALANYFVHGTFDPGDLMAVVLGALAAAIVLRLTQTIPEVAHGH